MNVTISLPEDISESLAGQWGDVSHHALETIAVEGYRTGALTERQVRRLLGLQTRFEVHALLKEHRVPLHYTESDLDEDLAAHRDLAILSGR
jgi:predicted HTH domain antitoxin